MRTFSRMSLRDDVIWRVVHQLVEALLRAAGLRKKKDLPAAEQALGEGLASLGLPLELLARVDTATLVGLVTDPARCALVGAALAELAAIRRAAGLVEEAERLEASAQTLLDRVDDEELPDAVREAAERARMPAP